MKDDNKTKKQLVHELTELRLQNAESISAELAAEEASSYAESIVETVREPLLVLDADLKIISANRNFYRTFEVTPDETIRSFIYDIGNKQWDIPKLRELLETILPEKATFDNYEVEHKFATIGKRIMLLNARKIKRVFGKERIILLAIEDITERRKLEEAHENLAAIVESAYDAIICKNLEGIIVSWNRGAEIAYGYNAEEVIGKSISLLMPPGQPDEYKESLKERSSGELIKNYETQRMRKDSKIVDVSLTISQLKGTSGEITGYSIIARDITERKQLEDLLQESEERYRRLFETASDGIVLLEKREGKITHANPATEKMLGYTTKESLGNKLHDIGVMLDMGDFQTTMQNLNKIGIINYDDVPVTTKSGQHIDADIYLVDRARLVQCNIRDITERKQAEETLYQTLESLKKAVSTTIQVIVSTVEARDPYTAGHQLRVANLAGAIATEMEFPPDRIEGIRITGSIHDLGKLSIPAEILSKPGTLSDIEFSLIKEHPRKGYEILKNVESHWPLAEIVYQHHERMDGSGYPRNLKGDEILMEARIIAVADVVEAMASHRPYRSTLGIDTALEEIKKNKGKLYDADVVDVCLKLFREKGFTLEKI